MPDDGTRDNAYGLNETQALKQLVGAAVDENALAAAPEPSLEQRVGALEKILSESLDRMMALTDLVNAGFDSIRANLAKMEPMAAELKGHAMGLMDMVKAEFAKAHDAINERLIALETRRHIRGQTP